MTKKYALFSFSLVTLLSASPLFGQDQFTTEFEPIRKELTSWDPVRGEWLASSLVAMSKNETVPDRMFPEDLTPVEMLRSMPPATQARVSNMANERFSSNTQSQQWQRVSSAVERVNCSPVMGRSYGDPHLSSFDGVTNSFQTVGEFVLVESASNNMTVHVRQKNTSDEISVTNAIAMNVAGDRVAIYGDDTPDGNRTTPLRVNGEIIYMENDSYYLSNGGVIRAEGGKRLSPSSYTIIWPTGETVKVSGRNQMNIAVQVYPCTDRYQGILGNANGSRADDYNPRGASNRFGDLAGVDFGDARMSDQMQKEYLAFMSKDFAMSWRITQQESLFDYGFNQNTMTFTDYSYPRVHRTINDMAQTDRERARRECERAGITGAELNGCIYDVGFARIEPSPRPVIADVSKGRTFNPVTRPVPNVNPGGTVPPRKPIEKVEKSNSNSELTPNVAQPIGTGNNGSDVRNSEIKKEISPVVKPAQGTSETKGESEKQVEVAPVTEKKPVVKEVKQEEPVKPAVEPVKPVVEKKPVVSKPAYEPPVEPEKPKRTVISNHGMSSPAKSEPMKSEPVKSEPVIKTPAPRAEPVRTVPTPSKPAAPVIAPTPAAPKPAPAIKIGRG